MIHSEVATPARDYNREHEDTQHQANMPRSNGEIHFNRNKEKGLEKFDGKTSELKPWRRRMNNYISEEDMSYADLIEWARTHKGVITEETEHIKKSGSGGTEESKLGIYVKEFSRKLYNCLCKLLGNTMEGRIDRFQGRGL